MARDSAAKPSQPRRRGSKRKSGVGKPIQTRPETETKFNQLWSVLVADEKRRQTEARAAGIPVSRLKPLSLSAAAKSVGMAPKTAKRLALEKGVVFKKRRGRHKGHFLFSWGRFHVISSQGRVYPHLPFNKAGSSTLGAYWNAVAALLERDDASLLETLEGTVVTDLTGKRHRLMTDPDALRELFGIMTDAEREDFFTTLYRSGALS